MQLTMSRVLDHYPDRRTRNRALAVVVGVTITLYYALYVKGSVAPQIIDEYDMSLAFYVSISIVGNFLGAFAALAGSVADRIGRTRIVLAGVPVVAAMTLVVLPRTPDKASFLVADVLQTIVLSAVLVATPALVRDFAPQLNRATAICTWNLGPILGSLLVSSIASRTLDDHPDWRFQLYVCGSVVAVAAVAAYVGLRELSPALRAQVVVSGSDPAAVDDRASGSDDVAADWRLLMTPRILVPAVAISVFLFYYVTRLAFWVIYFVTTFGYTPAEANGLSNWWWGTSAITLLGIGVLSDRLGVRKPLMLVGSSFSLVALALFASRADDPGTSYGMFVAIIVPAAFGGVITFGMWLTAYTQAIETISPALVATGLAIYGWILRLLVAVALLLVVTTVSSADTLVNHGAEVGRISQTYAQELGRLDSPNPARALEARLAIPSEDLAYLTEHGPDVAAAVADGPGQWQRWWWICLLAQAALIPTIWLLPGPWRRPRTT